MENRRQEEFVEIDLREYIMVLVENWKLIISIFLVTVALAGIYAFTIAEPVYQSTAKIKLGTNSGSYSESDFAVEMLSSISYWEQINNKADLDLKSEKLSNFVANNLQIETVEDTNIINISVNSKDPHQSKVALEELLELFTTDSQAEFKRRLQQREEYLTEVKNQLAEVNNDINDKQNAYQELVNSDLSTTDKVILNNDFTNKLNKLKELRLSLIDQKNDLLEKINEMQKSKLINEPIENSNPIKPNKKLIVVIAGVLGIMLAIFAAFGKEFLVDFKEDMVVKG
ncbi:MAG: Wzz/FepE/Etk N-terminal domain-containing protein [Bacillota bacterium]